MDSVRRLAEKLVWWTLGHRRELKRIALRVGIVLVIVVAVQLAYPGDRLLPFARIQDVPVGGMTREQAARKLNEQFNGAKLRLKTESKQYKPNLDELGLDVDAAMSATAATDYPLNSRLIPFSSLQKMLSQNTPLSMRVDDKRLKYYAENVQKENNQTPINAAVAIKDSKVTLVPAKPGKIYSANETMKAVRQMRLKPDATLQLQPQTQEAQRSDKQLAELLKLAQRAIDTPLTLHLNNEPITVEKKVVVAWIDFPEDPKTKELTFDLKPAEVQKYLGSIQGKVYIAPGTTTVNLVDGKEISRANGTAGRGIDMAKTTDILKTHLASSATTKVEVPLAALPPKLVSNRSYSQTQAGLQALLDFLAADKGGYGIAVMELGGRGWSAHANGSKRFETASTYKLFVAYSVLKQIESGQMKWDQTIEGNQKIDQCFEKMIVHSDNPCAEAFGKKISWKMIEGQMRGLGLSSTTLGSPFYSTVSDQALFLQKLEQKSLLQDSSRDKLLDAMRRQVFRSGVPAGTGVTVADKVGFLNGLLHDAAIVYGPKGPYVVVIMSQGSSWGGIADAARQIHQFLNR